MEGGTSDDMDFYWDACDRAMREEAIATGSDAADARRFRSSAFPPPEVDESLECVSVTLLPRRRPARVLWHGVPARTHGPTVAQLDLRAHRP